MFSAIFFLVVILVKDTQAMLVEPSAAVYEALTVLESLTSPLSPPEGFSQALETVLNWSRQDLHWRRQLAEQSQQEVTPAYLKELGFAPEGDCLVLRNASRTWEIVYDQYLVASLRVDRRHCRLPMLHRRGQLQAFLFFTLPEGDVYVRNYFASWKPAGDAA